MSFYNVTNPTTFSVEQGNKISIVAQGKMQRTSSTQVITITGVTSITLTAEQLISGYLLFQPTAGSKTCYLPSATDFVTLLMGPGNFDISTGDIFSFRVQNLNSGGNSVTMSAGTGGSGSVTVGPGVNKPVLVQVSVAVVAGVTTYGYRILNA